jgi:ABC-2 type transport system ATP-binding protein
LIEADRLCRSYGSFLAVDEVSFSIEPGEIVGLLGHNGAGKTTIMKMMTGYLEPSAGSVTVDGVDVAQDPKTVQTRLGYLPESLPLYPEMTVIDFLEYAAELRGVARNNRASEVRDAVDATELNEKAMDPIHTLSRGYRQRVGVAQAILHKPRFLILDEPTNGLDPSQTQHMRELIQRLSANATIILSTHIMQEVNAICNRAMILRNGKLVLDESLDALRQSTRLVVITDADASTVGGMVAGVEGAGEVEVLDIASGRQRIAVPLSGGAGDQVASAVANALVNGGHQVYALAPEQRDLESVFREVSDVDQAGVVS